MKSMIFKRLSNTKIVKGGTEFVSQPQSLQIRKVDWKYTHSRICLILSKIVLPRNSLKLNQTEALEGGKFRKTHRSIKNSVRNVEHIYSEHK